MASYLRRRSAYLAPCDTAAGDLRGIHPRKCLTSSWTTLIVRTRSGDVEEVRIERVLSWIILRQYDVHGFPQQER